MLTKYEEALTKLYDKSYEFATNTKTAFTLLVNALESRSIEQLKEAKALLKDSKKEEAKIDMRAVETLALYSPEATDLRRVIATIKIVSEFGRIDDYIKAAIATLMEEIINEEVYEEEGTKTAFYKSTLKAISDAAELIRVKDGAHLRELIRDISIEESKCDDFVGILEKNIITQICDTDNEGSNFAKRFNAIRKLERISDRCMNIAKLTKYAVEGGKLKL